MLKKIISTLFVLSFSVVLFSCASYADEQSVNDQAVQEARTPLSYNGWAVIKKNVLDADAPEDEWVSMRGIVMTDDGKKLRMMDGENPTPYELELIVITYENTNTTVLKLALYEDGKDKAITYIWGEPNALRLGMNLRWMQVGLTKAS